MNKIAVNNIFPFRPLCPFISFTFLPICIHNIFLSYRWVKIFSRCLFCVCVIGAFALFFQYFAIFWFFISSARCFYVMRLLLFTFAWYGKYFSEDGIDMCVRVVRAYISPEIHRRQTMKRTSVARTSSDILPFCFCSSALQTRLHIEITHKLITKIIFFVNTTWKCYNFFKIPPFKKYAIHNLKIRHFYSPLNSLSKTVLFIILWLLVAEL